MQISSNDIKFMPVKDKSYNVGSKKLEDFNDTK